MTKLETKIKELLDKKALEHKKCNNDGDRYKIDHSTYELITDLIQTYTSGDRELEREFFFYYKEEKDRLNRLNKPEYKDYWFFNMPKSNGGGE